MSKIQLICAVNSFNFMQFHGKKTTCAKHTAQVIWSQCRDSNPRPAHYECAALPAEPHWRLQFYIIAQVPAFVTTCFIYNFVNFSRKGCQPHFRCRNKTASKKTQGIYKTRLMVYNALGEFATILT